MARWVQQPRCPRLRLGKNKRREDMNAMLVKLYTKSQNLLKREEGQDLVEYALLVSLIALAAIVGIGHIATAVTTVFSNISNSLT